MKPRTDQTYKQKHNGAMECGSVALIGGDNGNFRWILDKIGHTRASVQ